jgi:hypothetical protein
MQYEIKSYVSVGVIRFGMTPDAVRKALNSAVRPSPKPGIDMPADLFPVLGITVDYRPPGLCEALEFFGPASPTFHGQHLLERPYDEVEPWIRKLDPAVTLNDSGLRSRKFGLGLFAPSATKEPSDPVKSVIVFEDGYYER